MSVPLKYYREIRQGKSPSDYAAKCCYYPKKVWVYDSVSGTKRIKYVNCGKCLYCKDLKRNEFVTRMFLHCLDYEHVYYVTLTYGSYNLNLYKSHPFKKDWLDTFPVCDSYNSSHRLAWTPTLVIESHVQKFFKRLRKNTGCDCTYVVAGELGGTFGRPHHHLIIYSHQSLTIDDIRHAWSYRCVHTDEKYVIKSYNGRQKVTPFWFNIGHVDFNDLVANGSLNWKSGKKHNGDLGYNANFCFNYVAKYLCKSHVIDDSDRSKLSNYDKKYITTLPHFVEDRLRNVYNSLPTTIDYSIIIGKRSIKCTSPGAFGDFIDKCDLDGHPIYDIRNDYVDDMYYESLKSYYNRLQSYGNNFVFPNHLLQTKTYETKKVIYNGRCIECCSFKKFIELFSQYFSCSRSTSIGRLYFEKEYKRFEKGNFALPEPFGDTLAFPSYYYSLLARKKSPFFFRKTSINSTSLVKGCLPNVYDFFSHFLENKNALFDISFRSADSLFNLRSPECSSLSGLIDPNNATHGSLLDITLYSSLHRTHYFYDFDSDSFNGFVYNPHKKDFDFVESISRFDMCIFILNSIEELCSNHDDIVSVTNMRNHMINLISSDPNSPNTISNYLVRRKRLNDEYNSKHFNSDKL